MRILITGATGLVGKALAASLREKGFDLLLASRSEPTTSEWIKWDPEAGFADNDLQRLEGLDAAVHLAGETVSGLRWTEDKKKAIRNSRVNGTRSMIETFAKFQKKPRAFITASAIGFYGDRGEEELTETSAAGDNFLSDVCREWEAESRRAEDLGIRTVLLRTGIVLSKNGGALAAMLLPFKMGVGGVVGSGEQWMSWISLDDMIGVIEFAIENENLRGAVNVTSPNPAKNAEFTRTLGEVLYRPTILPLPGFAVNLVFGEMGDALLLASSRVLPKRLLAAGYEFKYPDLKKAIEHVLK